MAPQRNPFTDSTQGGVLGGSLTGILELLPHLDRARFEPVLALYEHKPIIEEIEAGGSRVHVLPQPPAPLRLDSAPGRALSRVSNLWRITGFRARALVPILRRERPAIVYCSSGVVPSLPVVTAAAWCGIPVICHFKGFGRIVAEARFMSRWIDTAIFMTDELAQHALKQGLRCRRHLTIFDGIDYAACVPGGGDAVRREFGIPSDAPVVGIVGHVQGWKGQLLVAEAVARARRQVPDLRCLMVGGVHRLGAAYADRLRARIAKPDLAGHVILTGSRRDVYVCVDAMDVVLHASDREPFGRVLIEAMAMRRPLIAPREGGPLVIVVDGETGLLVPPRDPDALAAAIVDLMGDPARRQAMGNAGRARVEAVFGIREHVQAIGAVFDEILVHHRRAA